MLYLIFGADTGRRLVYLALPEMHNEDRREVAPIRLHVRHGVHKEKRTCVRIKVKWCQLLSDGENFIFGTVFCCGGVNLFAPSNTVIKISAYSLSTCS